MNAAFLLVTTAWLAGQAPQPPAAAPAPAPIAVAPAPAHIASGCNSCGSACDACNDCEKPGLFARLRDKFRSKGCNDCCDTCNTCATPVKIAVPCETTCGSCGACDSCCDKPSLRDRLRGMFKRNKCDDCCSTPCNSCGAAIAAPAPAAAPVGEPIGAPKKVEPPKSMPAGGKVGQILIPQPANNALSFSNN